MSDTLRVSVVIPVYNEGEAIVPCLNRILQGVQIPCEILVVYDDPSDSTLPHLEKFAASDVRVLPVLNTHGVGPARAIRSGIEQANAPVAVVTMADGSDDPEQIDDLCQSRRPRRGDRGRVALHERGTADRRPAAQEPALAAGGPVALLAGARRHP